MENELCMVLADFLTFAFPGCMVSDSNAKKRQALEGSQSSTP